MLLIVAVVLAQFLMEIQGLSVVEFAGTFPMMPYTTRSEALNEMTNNINNYQALILSRPEIHSSLIVFPEDALYSPNFPTRDSILPYLEVLPDVGSTVQCSNENVLNVIACLAFTLNSTVVVNMGELLWIDENKSDRKQFNVNVVVSPNGTLLAKYRKTHLYYEPAFDFGDGIYSTFPSTFIDPADGALYGILTCNDLTYFHNSIEPLIALGVKAILAPAWWVNLPPLMSGNAYFSSLSLSYNTTIAVAGCGMGWYCSGTGIYSQGRALATWYNSDYAPKSVYLSDQDESNLFSPVVWLNTSGHTNYEWSFRRSIMSNNKITTNDTENDTQQDDYNNVQDEIITTTDSNATLFRFTPQYEGEIFTHTVTSPLGLECTVSGVIGQIVSQNPVSLGVVSIRGLAPELGFPQWGIEYCGLVACPSDNCLSALVLQSNVSISSVKVEANFNLQKYRLFPILLHSDVKVIPNTPSACSFIDLTHKGSMQCENLITSKVSGDGSDGSDVSGGEVVGALSLSLLGMEIQQQ